MKKYICNNESELKKIAENLSKEIKNGVIALYGELGAGKTTFTQGFAKGLGIKEKIISPTFVLIKQHQVPQTKNMLYHIDLYRLDDKKDFQQLGLTELFQDEKNLILIEWAEKIEKILPKNTIRIKIDKLGDNQREIKIFI